MALLKTWWLHFVAVLALFAFPAVAIRKNAGKAAEVIAIQRLRVNSGAYDPDRQLATAQRISFEHFFYQWNHFSSADFKRDMAYASERNRWPFITIEPFPFRSDPDGTKNLFPDIVNGAYDEVIFQIRKDLAEFGRPVFIRWGHEMERVTGRYPWAQRDFRGYIAAYRHFVDKVRDPEVEEYFVWSPVGDREMLKYWPGSEYVNDVGLSVYSFPAWERDHEGGPRSFAEIFSAKYGRANVFDKPVIIAELGVAGDRAHQTVWMHDAFRSFPSYPRLKSVIYFNARDSESAWEKKYSPPDWHIDPTLLDQEMGFVLR